MDKTSEKQLRILLVDDTPENIKLVEKYIQGQGHEVFISTNGKEAIEHFADIQPDLVLMDVMMPEMDGYEATRHIRQQNQERWVPIIFLSALSDSENLIKGLEAGGDDYLTKPIELRILGAKIKAMQRIAAMQDRISHDSRELAIYHEQSEDEKELAREVLERITRSHRLEDSAVDVWCLSAEQLSGDVVALHRSQDGRLYMMVADATGHGLVAAFSQLPVTQVFYDMAKQGFSLSSIVSRINQNLYEMLPADRFVAATLAILDDSNNVVEIWNGGNPPAVMFDASRKPIKVFASKHPPLGIFSQDQFNSRTEIATCDENIDLLICSDGVFEVIGDNYSTEPERALSELVAEVGGNSVFTGVKQAIESKLGGGSGPDDISIINVSCNIEE